MNFALSFFIGFICTASLFALCFFCVVGIKFVLITLRIYQSDKIEQTAPQTKVITKRKKRLKPQAPVRSIEIDPNSIDRIYVKKTS